MRALAEAGLTPVVIDDLSSGHASFVPDGVPLVRGTILDRDLVEQTLREHRAVGVIHVAGYKYAGVSVKRPLHTYAQNVEGTRVVLEAMQAADVANIVFSSVGGRLRHARCAARHRGPPEAPRLALRRVEADRRVAAARPGDGDGRVGASAAPHLAALLQRRRLGRPDGLRHEPAQPVPARLRGADRGPHAPHQRRRLRHRRTARTCATTSTSPTSRPRTSSRRSGSPAATRSSPPTTSARGDGLSVRQIMDAMARVTGHRLHPRDRAAPRRRPRPDRRHRRARRARPRLGEPVLGRRDGAHRLGGPPGGRR